MISEISDALRKFGELGTPNALALRSGFPYPADLSIICSRCVTIAVLARFLRRDASGLLPRRKGGF